MWDYFDKIACITVDGAEGRMSRFKKNNEEVGFPHNRVEIYKYPRADTTLNNGTESAQTCYTGAWILEPEKCCGSICKDLAQHHLDIIQAAWDRGHKNVLIFEDDARWEKDIPSEKLQNIRKWLEENDWDIFYFGEGSWGGLPVTLDIFIPLKAAQTHAFAVNRNAMKIILDTFHNREHIDQQLIQSSLKKYAAYPILNIQETHDGWYDETKMPIDWQQYSRLRTHLCFWSIILLLLIVYLLKHFAVLKFKWTNNKR